MPNNRIANYIDALGFGPGQLYVEILAHGIWIADGMELTIITALAEAIQRDLNLSSIQIALLTSIVFVGVAGGCAMSGYLGDNVGRRPAILYCYALVACFSIISAFASSFLVLFVTRLLLGFSMGVGMPASLTIVNEISPGDWRVLLMGVRGIFFSVGNVFAVIVLIVDDPTLTNLHWRSCVLLTVIPVVVFGIASFALLPESPAFLEKIGHYNDAKKVLAWLTRCNVVSHEDFKQLPEIALPETGPAECSISDGHRTWWTQVCTVFNRHLAFTTVVMIASAFSLNFLEYGSAYAEPYVLQKTNADLAAGWQLFYKYVVNMMMRFLVIFPATVLSRRVALIGALSFAVIGASLFAWTGGVLERDPLLAVLYYAGIFLPQIGISLGFLVAFQVSVEIYPTWAASTGACFPVGAGKVGSIIAPFAFEFIQNSGLSWQLLYCIMIIFCVISVILATGLNNLDELRKAARDGEMDHTCFTPMAESVLTRSGTP